MSNAKKNALLGVNFSTATQRLRKWIMFRLIQETGKDVCFRCGERIEYMGDLSIEHKAPWQSAPNPFKAFTDMDNIAFSHLRCNSRAAESANARKEQCPAGHEYSRRLDKSRGTQRWCDECQRTYNREYMRRQRQHP